MFNSNESVTADVLTSLINLVVDHAVGGLAIFDQSGALMHCNSEATRVLGIGREEDRPDDAEDLDADEIGVFEYDTRKRLDPNAQPLARALAGEMVVDCHVFVLNPDTPDGAAVKISAAPIVRDQTIHGAAVFYRDVTMEAMIQNQLATANNQMESYVRKLENGARELGLITDMGGFLQSCNNLDEFYDIVRSFGEQIFESQSGGVFLVNSTRDSVECVANWGDEDSSEQSFHADDCWALRRGRRHAVAPYSTTPICKHMPTSARDEGYVCQPMMAQGKALGVLHLRVGQAAVGHQSFGSGLEGVERAIISVAESIAGALANLTLRETLSEQAIRDPLTQLHNRRYMHRWLSSAVADALRDERDLSVVMIDLDHFKKYNDTFGHTTADEVLKSVSALVSGVVADKGIASRYGGEEILLAFKDTNLAGAQQLSQSLCEQIRDLDLSNLGLGVGRVTASFGVACLAEHGPSTKSLLRCADKAMYAAKASGRDRVCVAELVSDPVLR